MSSNVYTSISELYQVDQSTIKNVRLVARKQVLIKDLSDKIEFFSKQVDTIAGQLKTIDHRIRETDLESKSIDERLLKDQSDLRNSVDIKVATKLEHEIQQLEAKRNKLDTQLIDLWEHKSSVEAELKRTKETFKEKKAEIEKKVEVIQNEINDIHSQIDEQRRVQQRLITQIDSWKEAYHNVKEHVGDPISLARKGVCSACDVVLPKSDQIHLLKHVILRCPGCFRLLFTTDLQ